MPSHERQYNSIAPTRREIVPIRLTGFNRRLHLDRFSNRKTRQCTGFFNTLETALKQRNIWLSAPQSSRSR